MKIKKDDQVVVIAGKDKGKKGKVLKVFPKENRVIVEGVNVQTKHQKPNAQMQQAGIMHREGAIDASNVMVWDNKAKAPARVGYKIENEKKVRISKKSGEILD